MSVPFDAKPSASPSRPDAWGGTPSARDILQQQVAEPWGATRAAEQSPPADRPKTAWGKDTRAVDILRTMAKFEPVEEEELEGAAKTGPARPGAPDASADDLLADLLGSDGSSPYPEEERQAVKDKKDGDEKDEKDEIIR